MAQVKIYGLQKALRRYQSALSTAIHEALTSTLQLPIDKKFQRFIALAEMDFIYPSDRSEQYTIIEISMFEGRSADIKKQLIRALFTHIHEAVGITPHNIEITLFETPKSNWGIRGVCADELQLNYPTRL